MGLLHPTEQFISSGQGKENNFSARVASLPSIVPLPRSERHVSGVRWRTQLTMPLVFVLRPFGNLFKTFL